MQRLFSTFARGAPGAGLLLLRVASAGLLLTQATAGLTRPGSLAQHVFQGVVGALAVLFLAGLWTPIVGVIVAIDALCHIFWDPEHAWRWLLLGAIGASLALVGPGAWSIDARLFGRKRVEISDADHRGPPTC